MKWLVLYALWWMMEPGCSVKILMHPFNHGSHVMYFLQLGIRLADNGHDVTLLHGSGFKRSVGMDSPQITFKTFKMTSAPVVDNLQLSKDMQSMHGKGVISMFLSPTFHQFMSSIKAETKDVFDDEEILTYLAEKRFDFIITEAYGENLLLAYYLGVPYSVINIDFPSVYNRRPFFTSQENGILYPMKYPTSFSERLINALSIYVGHVLYRHTIISGTEYIQQRFPNILQTLTYEHLLKNATFFFSLRLPVVVPPKSSMPNIFDIGSVMARPANLSALAPDLKDFVDNAHSGFILVCFGSTHELHEVHIQKLMDAFEQIKLPVLFKTSGEQSVRVPQNVKISPWIPQNDLLGHPNIRAMVTHCGFSGLVEALNHGVPIVGFPLSMDQVFNCVQMDQLGIIMDVLDFGAKDVVDALFKVISEDSEYRKNAKRISAIIQDLPDPGKTVSFWIDHVMKYGRDHLRSPAFDLEDYEYLGWDVTLVFFMVSLCLCILWIKCCLCCCKRWNVEKIFLKANGLVNEVHKND